MKFNLTKLLTVSAACIITLSVVTNAATLVGTSTATKSDTQTSTTGSIVALWGSTGTGNLKVRSTNSTTVTAEAKAVRAWIPDNTLTSCSSSTSTYATNNGFNLPYQDNGYYIKLSGVKSAKGNGEFEILR